MMFEAKLKNGSCPELDPVAVEFPIPEDRYEETIRALEDIRIGRADKQDCRIEEVFSANCPGLDRLTGTMANVDELDWLGRQLEAFDAYGRLGQVQRFLSLPVVCKYATACCYCKSLCGAAAAAFDG